MAVAEVPLEAAFWSAFGPPPPGTGTTTKELEPPSDPPQIELHTPAGPWTVYSQVQLVHKKMLRGSMAHPYSRLRVHYFVH